MARLGELLLAGKYLTQRELDSALENHVLHGVKLGTCLVEMGYVSDDDLARCLGAQTGQSSLTRDQLLVAGGQHLSLLAPAAIKKHRLIPVGTQGTALRIATDQDLSGKKQIELEKFLNRQVEPVAVSGYAVDCFLEQMFGIPRPGRFLPRYSKTKGTTEPAPVVTPPPREETPLVINGVQWKDLGEVTQDDEATRIYDEIFSGMLNRDELPRTLTEVAEQLCQATSRNDVAKTVLSYLSGSLAVAALLMIKDDLARGWSAVCEGEKIKNFEAFSASVGLLPDLQQCVAARKPFFGNTITPEAQLLMHTLRHPNGLLAYFPIFIQQRVVAVLVCGASEKLNPLETADLCRKASYALEILILRSKLLSS